MGVLDRLYAVKRWMYRGGRPGRLARVLLQVDRWLIAASGRRAPWRSATLEVVGRTSGRVVAVPVVVADHEGERYLVSMLGEQANWVRNVRAAGGLAVLRRGEAEPVRLEEVAVAARAPIIRRYLEVAPGARPHVPVSRTAPLAEFERIAADLPVFRVSPVPPRGPTGAAPGRPGSG